MSNRWDSWVAWASVAWMVAAILLAGCSISCHYDLVRRPPGPYPFGVDEVCSRPVCDSAVRLPASATLTGKCD